MNSHSPLKEPGTLAQPSPVSFWEAFRSWLKLGFISFGGPAGQIAIMHSELAERRRRISEKHFLHALNYCMVLPGPEAQQKVGGGHGKVKESYGPALIEDDTPTPAHARFSWAQLARVGAIGIFCGWFHSDCSRHCLAGMVR